MIPDDVDDLIDDLPQHMRNKVLEHFGDDEDDPRYCESGWPQFTLGESILWWTLLVPATIWGIAGLGATIALAWMPLFAIPMLVIAALPVGMLAVWRVGGIDQDKPHNEDPEEGNDE